MVRSPTRKLPSKLVSNPLPARLWRPGVAGRVRCELSPRGCNIPPGGLGFCGVRQNRDGVLYTLNYGLSVAPTEETIETEAVYHFAPGARILSLGNLGCMMACDFCHNWQTSQARLARDADIHRFTPAEIVDYAVRHGIRILSWTYNDPVVWHEFVVDTARLARERGLLNLYKSAFYITPPAIDELCEVIDIFSLSLKSMDEEFYRRHTKGRLPPVLDAIRRVYRSSREADGPHLEISNLCVTGRNDNEVDARRAARWVRDELDPEVPFHFVRFHPDYRYRSVPRTSVAFLERARRAALAEGLRYVYLGNVQNTRSNRTLCAGCGEVLVERYGPTAILSGCGTRCPRCGESTPLVMPWGGEAVSSPAPAVSPPPGELERVTRAFSADTCAFHVEQDAENRVVYEFVDDAGERVGEARSSWCRRFSIIKAHPRASAARIYFERGCAPRIFDVADRAHFPTEDDRQPRQRLPVVRSAG